MDDDDVLDENSKMYFIVSGIFKVQSGMFDMKNTLAEARDEDRPKPKNPKKFLSKGDYFGEVALMYGCRRTATVKATQYSQCSSLKQKDFALLM